MKSCSFCPGQIGHCEFACLNTMGTGCRYAFYCDYQLPRDSRSMRDITPEPVSPNGPSFTFRDNDVIYTHPPITTCNCKVGNTFTAKLDTSSSQIGSAAEIAKNTKGEKNGD